MRTRYVVLPAVVAVVTLGASAAAMAATSSSTPATAAPASVRANAFYAAKTESAAYQQYFAYAAAANMSGQPALADVWQTVGIVEHQDHWVHDVMIAGKYQSTDNTTNLKVAISQAKQSANADLGFATNAPTGSPAGQVLLTVAGREIA